MSEVKRKKYIIVHGHFYQPPRENPWTESVDYQPSASPFHDWNERITAECYEANAYAKLYDQHGRIERIVSNYEYISFNFGPTLMDWLMNHNPTLVQRIVESDRRGAERYKTSVGNAIAQAYNHIIMPLATSRDKETQIIWGIEHFKHVFSREPVGMWLPETAVDMETLRLMVKHGIKFTILAPSQISKVRRRGESSWHDVHGERVDPSRPYTVNLGNGESIVVFVFDGPISRAVAFEDVLSSGDALYSRIRMGFDHRRKHHQFVLVAVDGETFGHHKKFAELSLAYLYKILESSAEVEPITPYAYLERHGVEWEAQIIERTSWSCPHGLRRWYDDCGCKTVAGWHQRWRKPLREGLNWLKARLDEVFESFAGKLLKDPWEARNDYIHVILNRDFENVQEFLNRHSKRPLKHTEETKVLKLLEMQRYSMLMFTSCGWFFNDISGLETVQILTYAARAIQLAKEVAGINLEDRLLEYLIKAEGNLIDYPNGLVVWQNLVKPNASSVSKHVAEYAIDSLFPDEDDRKVSKLFEISPIDRVEALRPPFRIAIGAVELTSKYTWETSRYMYCVLYLGSCEFRCSTANYLDLTSYEAIRDDILATFKQDDITELIRLLDSYFPGTYYSLRDLSADYKIRIANKTLSGELTKLSELYARAFRTIIHKMRYLRELEIPIPSQYTLTAKVALLDDINAKLNSLLRHRDSSERLQVLTRFEELIGECCELDMGDVLSDISSKLENVLTQLIDELLDRRNELGVGELSEQLKLILNLINIIKRYNIKVKMGRLQNSYWNLLSVLKDDLNLKEVLYQLGEHLFFSEKLLKLILKGKAI